jgi:hypothetical protein
MGNDVHVPKCVGFNPQYYPRISYVTHGRLVR